MEINNLKIETELGPMGPELQLMINAVLIGADFLIQMHGDEGWKIFVLHWFKFSEDSDKTVAGKKSLLKIISENDGSYQSNWLLLNEFADRALLDQHIPKELNHWVAKRLRKILDGETAAKVFNLKKKRGKQVEFSEKLELACYVQYLRNQGKTYEVACAEGGEKWDIDPRTVGNWIEGIKIPNVSNKTLETLSRIGFYPLFS